MGGSPSIEALSPLLEDINNCGKKNKKKTKKKQKKKNKNKKTEKKQRYLENYKDLEAHIFRVYSQLIYGCRVAFNHCIEKRGTLIKNIFS